MHMIIIVIIIIIVVVVVVNLCRCSLFCIVHSSSALVRGSALLSTFLLCYFSPTKIPKSNVRQFDLSVSTVTFLS